MSYPEAALPFLFVPLFIPRDGDDPTDTTAVDFDADTFISTLRSTLEECEPKQDDRESDDSLSISDDEETSVLLPRAEEEEDKEMEELMTQMDEELSATSIGKSFERLKEEDVMAYQELHILI